MAQVPSDLKSKHPFLPLPIQAKAVMEPQLGLIPLLLLLCGDFVLCVGQYYNPMYVKAGGCTSIIERL